MSKNNFLSIGLFFLSFMMLVSCSQETADTSNKPTTSDQEASPFSLDQATFTTMDGKEVSLSSLKGKPVVINFWATWCGPCVEEMPSLAQAEKKWAEGYTFLVASDEELNKLKRFNEKKTPAIAIVKANFSTDLLNITAYPTTLFLDGEGKEVTRLVGARNWMSEETAAIFEKNK